MKYLKVLKVLNNNVVVSANDEGKEVVLMGNGIGFQKKVGHEIDENTVEKIFEIQDKNSYKQVEQMLTEIPMEIISTSFDILNYAKSKLNKEFNETSFISFADHLYASIQRNEKGISMKNFLLWDIKRFFVEELEIAKDCIDIINKKMDLSLSDDEAGFLALHIINAEIDMTNEASANLTKIIEEILTIVKYTLKIDIKEDNIYFQRFVTHLRYFAERVLNSKNNVHIEDEENDLFLMIKNKYPEAFLATEKIVDLMEKRWGYITSKDEQIYLTIHVARIIEKVD